MPIFSHIFLLVGILGGIHLLCLYNVLQMRLMRRKHTTLAAQHFFPKKSLQIMLYWAYFD